MQLPPSNAAPQLRQQRFPSTVQILNELRQISSKRRGNQKRVSRTGPIGCSLRHLKKTSRRSPAASTVSQGGSLTSRPGGRMFGRDRIEAGHICFSGKKGGLS